MQYPLFCFLLHPGCEQAPSQSSRQEQDQTHLTFPTKVDCTRMPTAEMKPFSLSCFLSDIESK